MLEAEWGGDKLLAQIRDFCVWNDMGKALSQKNWKVVFFVGCRLLLSLGNFFWRLFWRVNGTWQLLLLFWVPLTHKISLFCPVPPPTALHPSKKAQNPIFPLHPSPTKKEYPVGPSFFVSPSFSSFSRMEIDVLAQCLALAFVDVALHVFSQTLLTLSCKCATCSESNFTLKKHTASPTCTSFFVPYGEKTCENTSQQSRDFK